MESYTISIANKTAKNIEKKMGENYGRFKTKSTKEKN